MDKVDPRDRPPVAVASVDTDEKQKAYDSGFAAGYQQAIFDADKEFNV